MKNFQEKFIFYNNPLHKLKTTEHFLPNLHFTPLMPRMTCKQDVNHFEKDLEWHFQIS